MNRRSAVSCALFPRAGRRQCRLLRRWCHRAKGQGGWCSRYLLRADCCRSWALPRPCRQSRERVLVVSPTILGKTACGTVCRKKVAEMPLPHNMPPHPEQLFVHEGMTCTGKGFAPVLHPSLRIMRKSPGTVRKRTGNPSLHKGLWSGRIARGFTLHNAFQAPGAPTVVHLNLSL